MAESTKSRDQPDCVNGIVFPGDKVSLAGFEGTVRIGAGLLQDLDEVVSSKCGRISSGAHGTLWVNNPQKRYVPMVEDLVVGTVVEKHTENYRIDIGSTEPARLPALAFEAATKRNKPNIPVGALVYARVVMSNKHMEPELSCTSPHFKKDWVTGESLFGELKGGYSFNTTLTLARQLLAEDCHVLNCIGNHFPFEIAVGVNGRVWVNSGSPMETVVITNAILNSEHMTEEMISQMVEMLAGTLH